MSKGKTEEPDVYCVRADGGRYAEAFVQGGYCALGGLDGDDLSGLKDASQVSQLWQKTYPEHKNPYALGQAVGQMVQFLFAIKAGDFVVTPAQDSSKLFHGEVTSGYYHAKTEEGCPYRSRRKVTWQRVSLVRHKLSVPLQYTLRSMLAVFYVKHKGDFFAAIGRPGLIPASSRTATVNYRKAVLDRVLELSAEEFEGLLKSLLVSIGFEAERVGRTGDGGVDVEGRLDVYGLAQMDLKLQAKRYDLKSKVAAKAIRDFRAGIPERAQGAFVTTSDFQAKAYGEAEKPGFKRIGTITGDQLVDILVEKYQDLPEELRAKLKLKAVLLPE